MSDGTLIDSYWIRAWCPECGKYRRISLIRDEMQCAGCSWPVAKLRDPRMSEAKERRLLKEPLP
jgi:ribosomal protein L37E